MQKFPQDLVLCPSCKTGYLLPFSVTNGEVRCTVCATHYPVKDRVIDLLPPSSAKKNLAQVVMESKLIVRAYESRFWRRSPIATIFTRISFEQEYETIARIAKLKGSEILLDLACGTGIYARPLAHRLTHGLVVGVDLSMPMLSYASRRARTEGLENLLYIHGDVGSLPFSENRFDLVNCGGALHLFANLPHVLVQVKHVLKPGGRFTVAVFRKRVGPLAERVAHFRRAVLGVNAFRPDELESHFSAAGFDDVQCHHAKGVWLIMSATKPS